MVDYCFSSSLLVSPQVCLKEGDVQDVDQFAFKDSSIETFPRNKTKPAFQGTTYIHIQHAILKAVAFMVSKSGHTE